MQHMKSALRRALRTLSPFHPDGGRINAWHVTLVTILVLVVMSTGVFAGKTVYDSKFWRARHVRVLRPLTPQRQAFLLSLTPEMGATPTCYVPPVSLMRLTGIYAVVESEYDYDSTTLGSTACQDTDLILGYGASEPLRLPGPPWVHYTYGWTQYIAGSGYEETVTTPGGGRWAFYHVFGPRAFHAGEQLTGNEVIGNTGWPTSELYSNGSCSDYYSCKSDAHLCIATDYLGAAWLYTLVYNPPPKPKPAPIFPIRLFEQTRTARHQKPVPAYDTHHHLTWPASIFRAHQKLGGILGAGTWHAGRPGYSEYRYAPAAHQKRVSVVYAWPKTGRYTIRWGR